MISFMREIPKTSQHKWRSCRSDWSPSRKDVANWTENTI